MASKAVTSDCAELEGRFFSFAVDFFPPELLMSSVGTLERSKSNNLPSTINFTNLISFLVKVPVLSEKTFDTMPSSCTRFEERTTHGIFRTSSYCTCDNIFKKGIRYSK